MVVVMVMQIVSKTMRAAKDYVIHSKVFTFKLKMLLLSNLINNIFSNLKIIIY